MELGALAPLLVASAAVFAPATAWMARGRRRSPLVWSVFGIVLGPGALLLAWASPPGACVACGTRTTGWLRACRECGADVRSGLVVAPAAISAPPAAADEARPARRTRRAAVGAAGAAPEQKRPRRAMARPMAAAAGSTIAGESERREAPGRAAAPAARPVVGDAPPPRRPRGSRAGDRAAAGTSGPVALATGVYAGGSIGLEIGHRYTIGRDASELVILGPVETTPTVVAHRRELVRIDPVGVDDRLVITGSEDDRGKYLIRFQAVAGMPPEEVEQSLANLATARDAIGRRDGPGA